MGILENGILGGFRKKTGTVIGRKHRGQDIMTGLYRRKKRRKTSSKQRSSRDKFGTLSAFLYDINELVKKGFKKLAKTRNPVNVAFAYNFDHAFIEEGDEITLNYPKIVYSKGHIEGPESISMVSESGFLILNWLPQPQSKYCQFTDRANILVYNPVKGKSLFFGSICARAELSYTMETKLWIGEEVYCYIHFASEDDKIQGNSMCVGKITVNA